MQIDLRKIRDVLHVHLSPELVNEIELPEELLDPVSEEEVNERFFFLYHALIGKVTLAVAEVMGRSLTSTEIGFMSEVIQAFLKDQGF